MFYPFSEPKYVRSHDHTLHITTQRKLFASVTAFAFIAVQSLVPFIAFAESGESETENGTTTEIKTDTGSEVENTSEAESETDAVAEVDTGGNTATSTEQESTSQNKGDENDPQKDIEKESPKPQEEGKTEEDTVATSTETVKEGNAEEDLKKEGAEEDHKKDPQGSEDAKDATTTPAQTSGGSSGGGNIQTGNAFAGINILNLANVNIFNSEGWILLLNLLFGWNGDLDVRDMEKLTTSGDGISCGGDGECENGGGASVENTNSATIQNDVIVRANTGGNETSGDGAGIETGDAYAAANVVNVANTNIIDSNYLVLTLNNFGDWFGDLILPGQDFFASLFGGGSAEVTNTNSAGIENNVSAGADTGNNTATGTASTIQTGDASASANIVNHANTNLFGGNSVMLVFRIHGDWVGEVFSAPEGVMWQETDYGVEIFGGSVGALGGSTTATSTNDATITNNVEVMALTGENKAGGEGGSINTGNASAGANVVNVANTNVFGQNWILAVVNIFGNWTGNLAFGRPDLWIGGRAKLPNGQRKIEPGHPFKYTYTIANYGDADATDVEVVEELGDGLRFVRSGTGTHKDGKVHWRIAKIPAGKAVEVSYYAVVSDLIPYGDMQITNAATVSSYETDNNYSTNSERVDVIARKENYRQNGQRQFTPDPEISITKTRISPEYVTAGTPVEYKIVVQNDGGSAYHSVLVDTVTDEEGNVVYEQYWELDEIISGEEITIEYELAFNEKTPTGMYTNTAKLEAIGRHPSLDPFLGWHVDSPTASATVFVENVDTEEYEDKVKDMNLSAEEEDIEMREEDTDTAALEEIAETIGMLTHALAELEGDIRRYHLHLAGI